MNAEKLLITIDGPTASGKGTISRMLAEKLNLQYLPSGNIYRLLAKNLLDNYINVTDIVKIIEVAKNIDLHDIFKDDIDLNHDMIANIAAKIAKIPVVRKILYKLQRGFIQDTKGAVLEGRDMGSVVCPEANYKFFITASVEERARRRYMQLVQKDKTVKLNQVLADLIARDKIDSSRKTAPLVVAQGAKIIDTTNINAKQTVDRIMHEMALYSSPK